MPNPSIRLAQYAGRPLLLHPTAARELAMRVLAVDPRAFERSGGPMVAIRALASRLRGKASTDRPAIAAFDDYDDYEAPTRPDAYCPLWLGEAEDAGEWGWSLKQNVALLNIDTALGAHGSHFCGTWWHGYDTLDAAFREMATDERVRAIFARCDSPGGVVASGLPALAKRIRSMREAAGGKPVWFYADMAASAMYWAASAGDRIIASEVGLVGSIGAVITHVDYSKLYADEGIDVTAIQFGDSKTDGAHWKPLSEKARADLQAEIDQVGRMFVADVVAGRPALSAEEVLATQAACYLAEHDEEPRSGRALKLVDAIMSEEDAFAELAERVASAPRNTTGAPASADARRGATTPTSAAQAATEETDVKRSSLAALLGATNLTSDQKLAQISAMVAAEGEEEEQPAAGEGEGEGEGEGTGGDGAGSTKGEGGEGGSGEDEEEGEVDAKTAQAILDLPEAKGRDTLAKKLAFTPGMTTARAKGLLAAAGKETSLAQRMSGRDPSLSASGGTNAADMGSTLVADAKARREARGGR